MRKAMTRRPLLSRIDLVDWLRVRGHAQTGGAARDMILDGRVMSESHVVGIATEPRLQPDGTVRDTKVVSRVPASLRGSLRVVEAKPATHDTPGQPA